MGGDAKPARVAAFELDSGGVIDAVADRRAQVVEAAAESIGGGGAGKGREALQQLQAGHGGAAQ